MEQHEKRRAPRVTCSIGIHLQGEWTMVRAQVEDIGRLGARLRVTLRELGLESHAGITEVASHVRQLLTHDVVAHFCPELLGSLVQRRIEAVRVTHIHDGDEYADIGCRFDEPLTELDAAALGLPIPMEGETVEDASTLVEGKGPQTRALEPLTSKDRKGSAYNDLRFSLLIKKSDLGVEPGDESQS